MIRLARIMRLALGGAGLAIGGLARTAEVSAHVPPDPPSAPLPRMSHAEMAEVMQMHDLASFGKVMIEQFEWRHSDAENLVAWDAEGWYGSDADKLWLTTEGEREDGGESEGRIELLWDHVFARWWSLRSGVRHDFAEGPSRTWAAFGVQGLAPYWFEIDAEVHIGESGRTAARLNVEYELLFTQRLILQPMLELNLYGEDDVATGIGSGLSDMELGLRLRYEFRREFAPYAGVVWARRFGDTADLARAAGAQVDDVQFVAGLRIWF